MTYHSERHDFTDKRAGYEQLATQLHGLLAGETDPIANAANTVALIFDALPEVSWAGFYFLRGGRADRRTFSGKAGVRAHRARPRCLWNRRRRGARRIIVPDVNAFPGHIACDAASQSEVVVPLLMRRTGWRGFWISTAHDSRASMRSMRRASAAGGAIRSAAAGWSSCCSPTVSRARRTRRCWC